jgi:hypothetical protein
MASNASAALGAAEIAGTLVNPRGMAKKMTASVAGGVAGGVAGRVAVGTAMGSAYDGVPDVRRSAASATSPSASTRWRW